MGGIAERSPEHKPYFKLPFKSGWIVDLMLKYIGEEWSNPGDNLAPYYGRLFSRANYNISMLCHNRRLQIIENPDIKELLGIQLQSGLKFEAMFNKRGAHSTEDAIKVVQLENPRLLELKQNYPDRVKLFWMPPPPAMSFAVVDSMHTILEVTGNNHPRSSITRYQDPIVAHFYEERYLKTKSMAQEIFTA